MSDFLSSSTGSSALPAASIPCSSFLGWKVLAVCCGGVLGAITRFAVGNFVTACRKAQADREREREARAPNSGATPPYALARWWGTLWKGALPFPLATFISNAVGCLLIGVLTGLFILGEDSAQHLLHSSTAAADPPSNWSLSGGLCGPWKAFAVTGFIGALTTMSSLALEVVTITRAGMRPQALFYVLTSGVVSLVALTIGFASTRQFRDFSMRTHQRN